MKSFVGIEFNAIQHICSVSSSLIQIDRLCARPALDTVFKSKLGRIRSNAREAVFAVDAIGDDGAIRRWLSLRWTLQVHYYMTFAL